jgi:hypothetical protein
MEQQTGTLSFPCDLLYDPIQLPLVIDLISVRRQLSGLPPGIYL